MEKKHAYLIIAHNDFDILEKLLVLLDDDRNDIFIHIDKKVKSFDFEYFRNKTKNRIFILFQELKFFGETIAK